MGRLLEGVIDEVIVQPAKVKPIIVNFQNGELKDEEANKMSCGLFYDKKKNKTLLALSNEQIVYKGYKPDNHHQLTQTMLVLHNKRTGKIRLVQAERWSVSAVLHKPQLDDSKYTDENKIALLNKRFGSKKIKRRTEQMEKLKVDINAVKEDLEKAVSTVEIVKEDLETVVPDEDYITSIGIPPCDRDASNVKDVYAIKDIVPEETLETLYSKAKNIYNDMDDKSKFFKHAVRILQCDPENVKKIALLLYIEAVGKWLNVPIRDVKKRSLDICPYSNEINTHIIETYSLPSNNGRLRPTSMKDKALIHCIILGLIVLDFELNLELFATALNNRIGVRKLQELSRIILATPNKTDKKTVSLKLPLPNSLVMVKKGKKRRS